MTTLDNNRKYHVGDFVMHCNQLFMVTDTIDRMNQVVLRNETWNAVTDTQHVQMIEITKMFGDKFYEMADTLEKDFGLEKAIDEVYEIRKRIARHGDYINEQYWTCVLIVLRDREDKKTFTK